MDWDQFLAVEFWALVTMASALATAISTAVALLVRRRSRPEADWAFRLLGGVSQPYERGGPFLLAAAVTNAGDGYAFRVTASGVRCEAVLKSEPVPHFMGTTRVDIPFVPLVEPGQEDQLAVACTLENWDHAEIMIEWTRSPTRLRKRNSTTVFLREISPAPTPR